MYIGIIPGPPVGVAQMPARERPCAGARDAGTQSMAAHKNKLPATGAVPTGLKAWLLVVGFAVLLAGCGEKPQQAPAASAPPPPEVGVVTVELGPVPLTTELPGRLEASRVAQVRARVAGIIEKRLFEEGSDVKAG